jgi:hypothetical protein
LTSNKKLNNFCNLTFSYSISRIQTSTGSKPSPTPAARTNVSSSRPKAPLLGRKMVSGMLYVNVKITHNIFTTFFEQFSFL